MVGPQLRRVVGGISLGVTVVGGAAVATLGALNPAAAAAALAQVNSLVSCNSASPCISAANSSVGPGVQGTSVNGVGALGSSTANNGVRGTSSSSFGVRGTTSTGGAGVEGYSPNTTGVYGYTTGSGTGVEGYATSGIALYGSANTGTAMYGFSSTGVGGSFYSSSGTGVTAGTNTGYGLYSQSTGSGTPLYATTSTGYGLIAYTGGHVAVFARNTAGNAADLTGSYIGVVGRAPATGGFPLVATDTAGNNLFYVDGAGNVSYKGGLFPYAHTRSGVSVSAFSSKTSAPTVEDTGTAQLVAGSATVRLDPTFAATIDTTSAYRVFVTPGGDTHGLYVALKTPAGFIVREAQSGHSTVSFDYRIVATEAGQTGQRMAVATASTLAAMPRAALPAVPPALATVAPVVHAHTTAAP